MHKISDFIKTNKIFILIALIVLMSSFVALNLQYIGKNPFNSQINLDNPVKVCEGKDSFYFISDSSKKISVTDKNSGLNMKLKPEIRIIVLNMQMILHRIQMEIFMYMTEYIRQVVRL